MKHASDSSETQENLRHSTEDDCKNMERVIVVVTFKIRTKEKIR